MILYLCIMYYTVCYLTGIFCAVVRQISMLFIDNKISVFCILNTGFTRRTKTKDAFPSVTIQFRGLVSLTWMAHINTCSGTTITLPFRLSLAQHSLQWYHMWQEMSRRNSRKEEKFPEHNPIHVLQTALLSLLLAHSQTQTKSESVYPFPRNSIVPTSQQWRENNCVWNASRAVECRPVLVSRLLFGEPLGVYQR